MIGKHHSRHAGTGRRLPPAVPAVWQAVVQGGRRDPLRNWYAAVGVTMVVFLVVTSIGVISGRSAQGGYPLMVEPQGPALTVPPFNGSAPFDPVPPPAGVAAPPPGGSTGAAPKPAPHPAAPAAYETDRGATDDPTRDPVTGRPLPRDTPTTSRPAPPAAPRADPTTTNAPRPSRTTPPAPRPATANPPKPNPPKPNPPRPDPPRPDPPKPDPPRTTPTTNPPAGNVTARYIVYSSWQNGFTTGIELANNTGRTQTWKLKLIHERSDGVRVKELWNATLKQGGATTNIFIGGELAPGATLHFGFNASKTVEGSVRPTSCRINNKPCSFG